jgi:uncharacterized protein
MAIRKSRLHLLEPLDLKLRDLKSDWSVIVTIVVTTLVIVFDHYHAIFPDKWMDHTLLFLIIPVLLVVGVYRQPLKNFGFQWGDWKIGLVFTACSWVLMAVIMFFVARGSDFQAYYSSAPRDLLQLLAKNAFDLFGWEFIFRGLLVFSLFPICGPYAIVLQAVPFTIAHFGKPELETISCIFGGPLLGYIAWRTRSFLYPFLIHWQLTTITVVFVHFLG